MYNISKNKTYVNGNITLGSFGNMHIGDGEGAKLI